MEKASYARMVPMKLIAKVHIHITTDQGELVVPKGTAGYSRAVTNSKLIKAQYAVKGIQLDEWVYLCTFPGYIDETVCDLSQIEFLP